MKYQHVENVPNINSWEIIDNNCYYASGNLVKVIGKEVSIPIPLPYWGVEFNPSFFNVFTNRSVNTFFNYQGKVINTFEEKDFYYYFSDSSFIYYDRVSKRLMYNDLELLRGKMLSSYIFDDLLFFEKENKIQTINFLSGQFLWEFPLSSLGKWKNPYTDEEIDFQVRRLIGIYNNILWVFLNAEGFIGLDIETGELKYRIPEYHQAIGKTSTSSYDDSKGFFRSDYLLDNEKGKILGLAVDVFIEIDLTQEPPFVTQYGLQEEFEKYNIKKANDTAGSYVVQNNLLYFYLAEQLKFGILDINTKEIIYISEPITVVERDYSFTRLRDLKVSENKVYILDSNHTLHIFEREELNFELGTSCKLAPAGEAKSYYRN